MYSQSHAEVAIDLPLYTILNYGTFGYYIILEQQIVLEMSRALRAS
jgi:hypothetical protein